MANNGWCVSLKEYEQMSLYYDGELSGEELENFEKRLQDPEFARKYANFAQTLVNIADIPLVDPPLELRKGIMKYVREEARPIELFGESVEKERLTRRDIRFRPPRNLRPYLGAFAAVAACLVVIGGVFSLFGTYGDGAPPTATLGVAAAVEAEAADMPQQRVLGQVMSDGIQARDNIVRSAEIRLEVENLDEAVRFINALSGGHNESVNIHNYDNEASLVTVRRGGDRFFGLQVPRSRAHIVRRVPITLFNEHIEALRGLGNVVFESENSHSVSAALRNAQARREALNSEVTRLLAYLGQSDSVGDMTLISARIGTVDQEILDTQGRIVSLQHSINLPTVHITMTEVLPDDMDYVPPGFWQDVRSSFVGSVRFVGVVVSGLGVLFAGLVLPASLLVALVLVGRRVFRRLAFSQRSPKGGGRDET